MTTQPPNSDSPHLTPAATRRERATIRVSEAAAMTPLGPRRFRQLIGLETEQGKSALELSYESGHAVIDSGKALEWVKKLQAARRVGTAPRLLNLGAFADRCAVDPETRQRICIEPGCAETAEGRSKLCRAHRSARGSRRTDKNPGGAGNE